MVLELVQVRTLERMLNLELRWTLMPNHARRIGVEGLAALKGVGTTAVGMETETGTRTPRSTSTAAREAQRITVATAPAAAPTQHKKGLNHSAGAKGAARREPALRKRKKSKRTKMKRWRMRPAWVKVKESGRACWARAKETERRSWLADDRTAAWKTLPRQQSPPGRPRDAAW